MIFCDIPTAARMIGLSAGRFRVKFIDSGVLKAHIFRRIPGRAGGVATVAKLVIKDVENLMEVEMAKKKSGKKGC